MGTMATIIVSGLVGACLGFFLMAMFAFKSASISQTARTIQMYCEDSECYECDFCKADWSCKLRDPMKWELEKEEELDDYGSEEE